MNVEVLGLRLPQHGDGSLGGKSCKRSRVALSGSTSSVKAKPTQL